MSQIDASLHQIAGVSDWAVFDWIPAPSLACRAALVTKPSFLAMLEQAASEHAASVPTFDWRSALLAVHDLGASMENSARGAAWSDALSSVGRIWATADGPILAVCTCPYRAEELDVQLLSSSKGVEPTYVYMIKGPAVLEDFLLMQVSPTGWADERAVLVPASECDSETALAFGTYLLDATAGPSDSNALLLAANAPGRPPSAWLCGFDFRLDSNLLVFLAQTPSRVGEALAPRGIHVNKDAPRLVALV